MECCLICKGQFKVGDRIAKIICANIFDNCGALNYNKHEDEGVTHVDCLRDLLNTGSTQVEEKQSDSIVERTDILNLLGD